MSTIALTVNGRTERVDVDPTTPLLYVLSDDLGLRGPKFGCGLGTARTPDQGTTSGRAAGTLG